MANEAKYEVLIPKADNLGNPLIDLAPHAMHYLSKSIITTSIHVDTGRRVFWEGREEPFDALVVTAEDKPQIDSTIKQLAAYVGEVANQDLVLVSKHGTNGIDTWPIKNASYQEGQPAEVYVRSQPPTTHLISTFQGIDA